MCLHSTSASTYPCDVRLAAVMCVPSLSFTISILLLPRHHAHKHNPCASGHHQSHRAHTCVRMSQSHTRARAWTLDILSPAARGTSSCYTWQQLYRIHAHSTLCAAGCGGARAPHVPRRNGSSRGACVWHPQPHPHRLQLPSRKGEHSQQTLHSMLNVCPCMYWAQGGLPHSTACSSTWMLYASALVSICYYALTPRLLSAKWSRCPCTVCVS